MSKAYVQTVTKRHNNNNGEQRFTWNNLWVAGDIKRVMKNAQKRSKENPAYLFRAILVGDGVREEDCFPVDTRWGRTPNAKAVYYLNGENIGLPNFDEFNGSEEEWKEHMLTQLDIVIDTQPHYNIVLEEFYNRECRWWEKSSNRLVNRIVAHKYLSDKKTKWNAVGKELTRVTYNTIPDGDVEVEYWLDNKQITFEHAAELVAIYEDLIEKKNAQIIQKKNVGGVILEDRIANAFQTDNLDEAARYFATVARQLQAIVQHGNMTDEQRNRVVRVEDMMLEAALILTGGE